MIELADAAGLGFDAARLARIDPFLKEQYIDSGRLPNAQVLVAREGRQVSGVHGGEEGVGARAIGHDDNEGQSVWFREVVRVALQHDAR